MKKVLLAIYAIVLGASLAGHSMLPVGAAGEPVAIVGPVDGYVATDWFIKLEWDQTRNMPYTQAQVQIVPFQNDGPGLDYFVTTGVNRTWRWVPSSVLLPGMTHTWRVRGLDESTNTFGDWTTWRSFRTPPATGRSVSSIFPGSGETIQTLNPTFRWRDTNPGVFYYEIQVSKDSTFNTDPATATASVYWNIVDGRVTDPRNSWTLRAPAALEHNTGYFWRVRPRLQGDAGEAAWSNTSPFVAMAPGLPPVATPVPPPTVIIIIPGG